VLLFDDGEYRNMRSAAIHAFLSREGTPPLKMLAEARNQVEQYGVVFCNEKVLRIEPDRNGFSVSGETTKWHCVKVVLAVGVKDKLPQIPSIETFYGKTVFHCPYCDAWEFSGKRWAVYAATRAAALALCRMYKQWTDDLTLLAAYTRGLTSADRKVLRAMGVLVVTEQVSSLNGEAGMLSSITAGKNEIPCDVLFFSTGKALVNPLCNQLPFRFTRSGKIWCDHYQETNVSGVYATGDAARDMPLAVIAAAEGAKAGVAINMKLAGLKK
jgi:thioredoxin reductase